jgi:hypothetical protein
VSQGTVQWRDLVSTEMNVIVSLLVTPCILVCVPTFSEEHVASFVTSSDDVNRFFCSVGMYICTNIYYIYIPKYICYIYIHTPNFAASHSRKRVCL